MRRSFTTAYTASLNQTGTPLRLRDPGCPGQRTLIQLGAQPGLGSPLLPQTPAQSPEETRELLLTDQRVGRSGNVQTRPADTVADGSPVISRRAADTSGFGSHVQVDPTLESSARIGHHRLGLSRERHGSEAGHGVYTTATRLHSPRPPTIPGADCTVRDPAYSGQRMFPHGGVPGGNGSPVTTPIRFPSIPGKTRSRRRTVRSSFQHSATGRVAGPVSSLTERTRGLWRRLLQTTHFHINTDRYNRAHHPFIRTTTLHTVGSATAE